MANKDKVAQEMTVTQRYITATIKLLTDTRDRLENASFDLGDVADGNTVEGYDDDDNEIPVDDKDKDRALNAHVAICALIDEIDDVIDGMQSEAEA